MQPTICVFNESALVTDDEAQKACAAIQRQLTEHFEPLWNCTAVMHFAENGEALPAGAWTFKLVDTIDEAGALGYHALGPLPYALVDVALCKEDNSSWSSCLSHEVLEAVADPDCIWCAEAGSKVYSLEVCDATEASAKMDGTPYEIDGVVLENFITPNWFVPASTGPWDYLGILPGPLTRTWAGYDQTASLGRWTQHNGNSTRAGKRSIGPSSRRAKRGVVCDG